MKREAGVDISRSRTTAQHHPRQECDLVTVPARQGLEAADILRRGCDGLGPVMHDNGCDTLGFLVPPGTADGWDMPGSACTETAGRGMRISDGGAPGQGATHWLVPPGDAYTGATDPAELRAALGEAARTIEAVDRCQ
jgi:hypothetical protein